METPSLPMEPRTFQLLEFPKILRKLSALAVSVPGRQAALAVRPFSDSAVLAQQSGLLLEVIALAGETGFRLKDFPSLDGIFSFLASPGNVLDLDGLWGLFETLSLGRELKTSLDSLPEERFPLLTARLAEVRWPEKVWSGLKRCLSQDGRLRDESSPELFSIRQEIRVIHQKCTKKVKDFVQTEGIAPYLQDEFMTISSDRYVLPLKTNFKGRVQGIVHDYSQTGETCYFEPYFLVDVNNELQDLKQKEREEEHRIMVYLTDLVRGETASVTSVYGLLVEADVLFAKAALAAAMNGRIMPVEPGGRVNLRGALHPLLALDSSRAKPIDIYLEEGQRILIISGGNAGGKTVCLKTLGLIALMAQSALPVPVKEGSGLPFFEDVYVFMGDEQSLEAHVSTFTGQIQYLSRVWGKVGPASLILLDEFGAGTDPTQGAALAQAVIDAILDKEAYAAAATHFPALKAYGLSKPGVRAASVLFDPASKRPLYQLAYDQVGASLALDVARESGLPAEILSRAEQYLMVEGADASGVIERLNDLAVRREEELRKLSKEREDLHRRREKLSERFEAEKSKMLEELRSFSRDIMRKWQEGKIGRKEAMRELAESRRKLSIDSGAPAQGKAERPAPSFETVEVGKTYRYTVWDRPATVVSTDARRRQVKVDMGGVSIWVKPEDLAETAQPKAATGAGAGRASAAGTPGTGMSLDLRGIRAEDVAGELARFLDSALLRGLSQVEIIHGRGTGALRRETHAFLKGYPAVKHFELAPEDRGGDGLTIAELR